MMERFASYRKRNGFGNNKNNKKKMLKDDVPSSFSSVRASSSNALTVSLRSEPTALLLGSRRSEFTSLSASSSCCINNNNHSHHHHLNAEEVECMNCLRTFCFNKDIHVSGQTLYRFAIFHGFNVKRASNAIAKTYDHPYLHLRMEEDLSEFMLQQKTIFPLPGLKSAMDSNVLYWRPSRYFPSSERNRLLIENLCYCLNDMMTITSFDECRKGILLIVNMDGYSHAQNFHKDTQKTITKILEGNVIPIHLVQILIVHSSSSTPTTTTTTTTTTKLLLSKKPTFLSLLSSSSYCSNKRIQIISCANKIGNYLMEGYQAYLPEEFLSGKQNTCRLVEDYVHEKLLHEETITQGGEYDYFA